MASVTASLALPVCQLFLCLPPCAVVVVVVGAASRPSLIKEHKGDCCGSSCVWVLSPGRPDRPASHGAGSSCVLCVSSHGQHSIMHKQKERKADFPYFWTTFFKFHNSVLFYLHSILSDPAISISFSCLFNQLFFLCFAQSYYSSTVSLAQLSLPVCSYSSSILKYLSKCWKEFF